MMREMMKKWGMKKWQEIHCFLGNQKMLNTKSLYQIKAKST